jgi:nucleotide-binding universal stress UspA family protein
MKKRRHSQSDVPEELPALLASLEAEERAKVEALFETALAAAQEKRVVDFWDQPQLSVSHWVLMLSGINEEVEVRIADTLLRWKAFYVRDAAALLCVQSSERARFRCCSEVFAVEGFPTLVLGDSPEMKDYIRFEPQLILPLASQHGGLHRFLAHVHAYVENGKGLREVATQLSKRQFWRDLELQPVTAPDAFSFVSTTAHEFDIFLSHNSKDKATVRRLAKALKARGIKVWFDEWHLIPGRPWQDALEDVIENVRAAAVLVGKSGFGPWEIPEMRGCLSEFVRRGLPVIPVLLPGADNAPKLPLFLRQFTWVDFRKGLNTTGLDRLRSGITGELPTP